MTYMLRTPKCHEVGTVIIAGSFAPAAGGAVTDVKGKGFSVARSGTGEFTITLDRPYSELVSAVASSQLAVAADAFCVIGAYDATAKTLKITNITAASAADVAANANNRINFQLVLRTSNV